MHRAALEYLTEWGKSPQHKPLVIRGARQVGKTYLVRMYAETHFNNLAEINFDISPEKKAYFELSSIDEIIRILEVDLNQKITPGQTLLFLDEVQAAPQVLHKLRYFYEERPDLHVISAGSLLDFVLGSSTFSMPVGRIEYLHLGPMTFEEFLLATEEESLFEFLQTYSPGEPFPLPLHHKLMQFLKWFLIVGGMPAAVKQYSQHKEMSVTSREHHSIIQSYLDDLNKYAGKFSPVLLQKVFRKIPSLLTQRVKYVNVAADERAAVISECIHLLELARVTYKVAHSASNGVPLGAERKEKEFKLLFLDVGMASTILGLKLNELYLTDDLMTINQGSLCEQFIGQHLLFLNQPYAQPELYFWHRQRKSSAAEVDYVHTLGQHVVPIEVKSGKSGSLRSLHMFLQEKGRNFGVRFNSDTPTYESFPFPGDTTRNYSLLSLPLYFAGQLNRMLPHYL